MKGSTIDLIFIDEARTALGFGKLQEAIDTMLSKKPEDRFVGTVGKMALIVDERPPKLIKPNESKYIPRTKRSK